MTQTNERRTIKVMGFGKTTITPDTAMASVGCVMTAESVKTSLRLVDQRMNAVIAVIKESGIPDEQIKTVDYSVNVVRDYQSPSRPITGYSVSHIVRISVTPPRKVGDVIGAAVDVGANFVDAVRFTTADASAAVRQARSLAMGDALGRARQLADAANLELGDPLTIVEGADHEPVSHTFALAERSAAPTTIEAGQQEIDATVSVVYEAHSKSE